ncbi:hypothetical protein C1H46_028404 [Malus baccata]|uniref:Serine aminopeptidase S33 domain-containing protein n=1 Tax=Malus baccata TaxID=106549 RepID=A0A540LHS1_MALBA|nr:hypothetical protein C1H46_028404 [Malus baccata]
MDTAIFFRFFPLLLLPQCISQAKLSLVSLISQYLLSVIFFETSPDQTNPNPQMGSPPEPTPSIPIITAYTTGYGRNSRGMEIFCKRWLPKVGDRIKGALCFCHGYGTCTFFFEGRSEVKGLPFFVMGESMGGAMSLKIHLKELDKWDGVIVVAPTCKDTHRKTFVKSVFNCTGSGLCISRSLHKSC